MLRAWLLRRQLRLLRRLSRRVSPSMPHVLDRAEFGRLFVEHARVLWVVAAAFVPKAMVEDVLQDAAAVALSRLPDFDATTSFRAWMTQIVRFTAANAQRRARRGPRAESIEADDVPASVGASLDLAVARNGVLRPQQTDFDDHVLHALQELPADARASLLLRVVMDLSYADIATTLDLPEGTVASHVHRARDALRATLGAQSVTSHVPSQRAAPTDAPHGGRT